MNNVWNGTHASHSSSLPSLAGEGSGEGAVPDSSPGTREVRTCFQCWRDGKEGIIERIAPQDGTACFSRNVETGSAEVGTVGVFYNEGTAWLLTVVGLALAAGALYGCFSLMTERPLKVGVTIAAGIAAITLCMFA